MKRRFGLLLAATGIMIGIALLGGGAPKESPLLMLTWSGKSGLTAPPAAIIIEMGLKDAKATAWDGTATVRGAKIVHREGYGFRAGEKLLDPDAWQASSHRPLRAPPKNPVILKMEGVAPVGVVLHLADAKPDATLALSIEGHDPEKAEVPLKDVLAGKPAKIWDGAVRIRRISTTSLVSPVAAKTEDDFPAAAYGPDGTLWVAYIAYTLKDEGRRIEQEALPAQPKDFKEYYQPEFGDQLFVKYLKGGKWSEPIAVTDNKQDLVRCALAVEEDGTPWVVYADNRGGNHDLYARPVGKAGANPPRPGPEVRLTTNPEPDLSPVLTTLEDGRLLLGYQRWENNRSLAQLRLMSCKAGKWSGEVGISRGGRMMEGVSHGFHAWHPAVAGGPQEAYALIHDEHRGGNYDLGIAVLNTVDSTKLGVRLLPSSRFEARPSICYDALGRLWIAYEEGPELWGKDFGAFDHEEGNPLYFARTIEVVCLDRGQLKRPVADLPPLGAFLGGSPDTGQKVEALPRYAYPQIGIDGKGRIWLTYRVKFGSRYSTHPGSYWISYAQRLDGDQWTEPIELHHSDGLLDHRPVLLSHAAGGLTVIHSGDGRWVTPEGLQNRIWQSYVDLPGNPVEPKLKTSRTRSTGRRTIAAGTTVSRTAARSIASCAASSTATPKSRGTAARTAPSKTCSAMPSMRPPSTGSVTATTTTAPAASTPGG